MKPLPREEAERRDRVLRGYIEGLTWDIAGEHALRRHLVMHSLALLPTHPLLIGLEWEARLGQAGDLLFYDGAVGLVTVELKVTEKNDVARRLHKVDAQARAFAQAARKRFPWATVQGLVYTSVEHAAGFGPRPPRPTGPQPQGFTPQAEGAEEE